MTTPEARALEVWRTAVGDPETRMLAAVRAAIELMYERELEKWSELDRRLASVEARLHDLRP